MSDKNYFHSATPHKKLLLRLAFTGTALLASFTISWAKFSSSTAIPNFLNRNIERNSGSRIIFNSNFENGSLSNWQGQEGTPVSIVANPVRHGNKAVRFELRKGTERTELRSVKVHTNGTYWYRWSVFIPKDFESDPSYDIIGQFNDYTSRPVGWWGTAKRHIPLYFKIQNDNWFVRGTHQKYPSERVTETFTKNLGPVIKDVWNDFVVHVKWSYTSEGFVEIWKNGELVFKRNGSMYYNLPSGPFFKIGIYKGDPEWPGSGDISKRVIYVGGLRIAEDTSN